MPKVIAKHGVGKLKCHSYRFEKVQVRHDRPILCKSAETRLKIVFSGGLGGPAHPGEKNGQKIKNFAIFKRA